MCICTCHVGYMGTALYECILHDIYMHICICHMCTCMVSALCYKSVCMLYVHITTALYGCTCVDIMPCVALLGACTCEYIVCRWKRQKGGADHRQAGRGMGSSRIQVQEFWVPAPQCSPAPWLQAQGKKPREWHLTPRLGRSLYSWGRRGAHSNQT